MFDESVIDSLWEAVRCEISYNWVISAATLWLKAIWPHAYRMGFAPRGKGYDEWLLCTPPSILVKELAPLEYGYWSGNHIVVTDYASMRRLKGINGGYSERDELRKTILHEAQHAFDALRGVVWGEERDRHDAWFARRLARLEARFAPEG